MNFLTQQGGDWLDASTWTTVGDPSATDSLIPGVNDSVEIAFSVTVSRDVAMGDGSMTALVVDAGAVLTIKAGATLLVYGAIGGAGNINQAGGSVITQLPITGIVEIDDYTQGTVELGESRYAL